MNKFSLTRGINRSKKWAHLVKRYVHDPHPSSQTSMFRTIKDLMYFAALLGFHFDKRRALSDYDDGIEDIQAHIFASDEHIGIMLALGLVIQKDASILKEENEKLLVEIFEEYANGGFEILNSWQRASDNIGDISLVTGLMEHNFFKKVLDAKSESENEFANFTF